MQEFFFRLIPSARIFFFFSLSPCAGIFFSVDTLCTNFFFFFPRKKKLKNYGKKILIYTLLNTLRIVRALRVSNLTHKKTIHFPILILSQFVVSTTSDRRNTAACSHYASVQLVI